MSYAVFESASMRNPSFREVRATPLYTTEECGALLGSLPEDGWRNAGVTESRGAGSRYDATVRSATLQNLPQDETWPSRRLLDAIGEINSAAFRFDIRGIDHGDPPSVVRYEAGSQDHFRPHQDAGASQSHRKLTFVVQLSPPDSYVGGDLVFLEGGSAASREQGTLTVFPSFLTHVVSPVVAGTRFAVVGWIHGPTFR